MEVIVRKVSGSWRDIADEANNTVSKPDGTKEPSNTWKKRMLLSEHSPIRAIDYFIRIKDCPYWVSVHLVRHKIGIEHWVSTQRSDRTGISREEMPQNSLVTHDIKINLQALINISRKRLCFCASRETRELWEMVKKAVAEIDPIVGSVMVPDCVYRGKCYEMKSCGFSNTDKYQFDIRNYRDI